MYYDLTNTVNILQNLDLVSIFFIIYLAMKNIFRIECLTHSHLRIIHTIHTDLFHLKREFLISSVIKVFMVSTNYICCKCHSYKHISTIWWSSLKVWGKTCK